MTIDAAHQHPSDTELSVSTTQVLWNVGRALVSIEHINKRERGHFREMYGATFVLIQSDEMKYFLLAGRSGRSKMPSQDLVRAAIHRLQLPDEAAVTARGVITHAEHRAPQISLHSGAMTSDDEALLIRHTRHR